MGAMTLEYEVTAAERAQLRKLLTTRGEVALAKELGVARGAMLRVLADLPVRKGTVLVLRAALAEKRRISEARDAMLRAALAHRRASAPPTETP
jgi:hypothetical protein